MRMGSLYCRDIDIARGGSTYYALEALQFHPLEGSRLVAVKRLAASALWYLDACSTVSLWTEVIHIVIP